MNQFQTEKKKILSHATVGIISALYPFSIKQDHVLDEDKTNVAYQNKVDT
jgi:hypothetical protein